MKIEVSSSIEELKKQFNNSTFTIRDDESGGAYITIDNIYLGERFRPTHSWVGFQIPAQYPYADIYPVFIGGDVVRVDGIPFVAPVTLGHSFEGKPAIQVSRRNGSATSGSQKASSKILKILDFLGKI